MAVWHLGQIRGEGPLGQPGDINTSVSLFNTVVSNLIGFLTIIAGLWFVVQFLLGAFSWLTSGGDKAGLEGARKRIANSLIGLILVVAAIFLLEIIGRFLGLDLLRPGNFLLNIWA